MPFEWSPGGKPPDFEPVLIGVNTGWARDFFFKQCIPALGIFLAQIEIYMACKKFRAFAGLDFCTLFEADS